MPTVTTSGNPDAAMKSAKTTTTAVFWWWPLFVLTIARISAFDQPSISSRLMRRRLLFLTRHSLSRTTTARIFAKEENKNKLNYLGRSRTRMSTQQEPGAGTDPVFGSLSKVPLIDVDCNLWHKDLKPLLPTTMSSSSLLSPGDGTCSNSSNDTTVNGHDNDPLAILAHDAMEEANILAVLSPSSTIAEAQRGVHILQQQKSTKGNEPFASQSRLPHIRTTVGVHPYHVNDDDCRNQMPERMAEAAQLILAEQQQQQNNKNSTRIIAAVGECGLDTSDGFPPLADQIPWFQAQIQLAVTHQLPLFVHERFAHAETMELLQQVPSTLPVLIHCFTGTLPECQAYMDRGYYISFSGYICKTTSNNNDTDDPIAETISCLAEPNLIPLDRLMIETDAPYLGFPGCRDLYLQKHEAALQALSSKKRKRLVGSTYPNLPSSLPRVLQTVCNAMNTGRRRQTNGGGLVKAITLEELAWQTSQNADRFFQFGLHDVLQANSNDN